MRRTRRRGDARRLGRRGGPAAQGDRVAFVPALVALALAGCEIPKEVNPVYIYREVSGLSDQGRAPPPGLDQPFPNLAVVPPRPERPPLDLREGISAGLAADRAAAREPPPAAPPGGVRRGGTVEGGPPLSGGPPPRPALARAPVVPWIERVPVPGATGGQAPDPAAARPTPAEMGSGAPAAVAPAPGALAPSAPPPRPSRDLLGPAPLPPPDPSGPPPPPSPDLLGPPR